MPDDPIDHFKPHVYQHTMIETGVGSTLGYEAPRVEYPGHSNVAFGHPVFHGEPPDGGTPYKDPLDSYRAVMSGTLAGHAGLERIGGDPLLLSLMNSQTLLELRRRRFETARRRFLINSLLASLAVSGAVAALWFFFR